MSGPGASPSIPPAGGPPSAQRRARRWRWAAALTSLALVLAAVGVSLQAISAGTGDQATTGQAYGALFGMVALVAMVPLAIVIGLAFAWVNRPGDRSAWCSMAVAFALAVPFLRPDPRALLSAAGIVAVPIGCAIMAMVTGDRAAEATSTGPPGADVAGEASG